MHLFISHADSIANDKSKMLMGLVIRKVHCKQRLMYRVC